MVFFGKIKDNEEYCFSIDNNIFDSYVEVDEEKHMALFEKANRENKTFGADKDGNPILVDRQISQEELTRQKIMELEDYLRKTDWYAIRFAEEGTAVPEEVKKKRRDAREEISSLRKSLEEEK